MPSGTRPPGRRREPAYGLVPVNLRAHRASRTPSLKPALGNAASSPAAGIAIMVTFALVGFLLGWLWTRLYLPGALLAADVVKAISIRGDARTQGYWVYELGRATCLIYLDQALFAQEPPVRSSPAQRERIVNDLRVAVQLGGVDQLDTDADQDIRDGIRTWMRANGVNPEDLTAT